MITVTGATGQLGRLVIEALLARVPAGEITAAVRSPEKAADMAAKGVRVVRADYNDPASLRAAFAGTDRLLLISGNEFGQRDMQYERLVAAAQAAGVRFIGYTSIPRATENPMYLAQDHKVAERLIAATGIPYAFLRNSWYGENYAETIKGGVAHGGILGAAKTGRISAAPRADYAEAAAIVMAEALAGVFELGGSTSFAMDELAGMIAKVAGKPVGYHDLPVEAYAAKLIEFGLPELMAKALADADRWVAEGWLEVTSGDLEALLGRPTVPMETVVKAVLA